MRVLLQFPEGLKKKALEFAKKYEKQGHEVFLSASPCYGACDLALDEARWIKADKIVHFGHNRFIRGEPPVEVEYIEYSIDIDVKKLGSALPYIKDYKTIALATTVQHIHQLDEMRAFFEKNGRKVLIGKGIRAEKQGQILGCDAGAITGIAKKADAVVIVVEGAFHPLAVSSEAKPVFVFNPYDGSVKEISAEIEKARKKRKGAMAKALTCKNFGILLSTKPGQFNPANAQWAKKELVKRGLEAAVLVANELDPMSLGNFMVFECFITTACPRIADDSERFGRPVLDIMMLKELLGLLDLKNKGFKKFAGS